MPGRQRIWFCIFFRGFLGHTGKNADNSWLLQTDGSGYGGHLDRQVDKAGVAAREGVATTGWNVTAVTTGFLFGTIPLPAPPSPATTSLTTNGSASVFGSSTGPSATCATGSTCTAPTNVNTYRVSIGTTTPLTIFDNTRGGLGSINIGAPGTDPVGWWLNVPASTLAGTYTGTVTLVVNSGP